LIPNPIHKVLSTFQNCRVRALLMGGQACVFYGAAEFSRDTDFAILANTENLERLQQALDELKASVIAVPPFEKDCLLRGHAVHFRCQHPEAFGLRVDVMAKMRGVPGFDELWERRTILQGAEGAIYEMLSLPDLVKAKKTQRDKDWPMIRRLIEADHSACLGPPTPAQVSFWLREARTPELLIALCRSHAAEARALVSERSLLAFALEDNEQGVEEALFTEERSERIADKAYWEPLKRELEQMRRQR